MIVTDVEYDAMDDDVRKKVVRVIVTQSDSFESIAKKYNRVKELNLCEYGEVPICETSSLLYSCNSVEDVYYVMENPRKIFFHPNQRLKGMFTGDITTVVCGTFDARDGLLHKTKNVKCDTLLASLDVPIQNIKAKTIRFSLQPHRDVAEFQVALNEWLSKCDNVEYDKLVVVLTENTWCVLTGSRRVDDQEFHELFE